MLDHDAEKTARFDTVDHPMIESERERHYLPDNDLSVACDRAIFDLAQSQYGHFGIIDDRGTVGGTDDPVIGNRKRAASQLWEVNLSMPRFLGEAKSRIFFWSASLTTKTIRPSVVSTAMPML